MKTKILFVAAVVAACCLPICAAEDINLRSGFSNSLKHFERREYHRVVTSFGGDVLKSDQTYCRLAREYFREKFPGSNIGHSKYPDLYGSWYGAFRVCRSGPLFGALVHDTVFTCIDFCSSDEDVPEQEAIDAYEGMVRSLRGAHRGGMDIVFVYTLSPKMLDDFKNGRTPKTIEWAEKVAVHYNLPSINMAKYAAGKILSGEIAEKDFFAAGIAPTPKGEAIYAEKMKEFLELGFKEGTSKGGIVGHKMPEPLSPTNMQLAQVAAYEWGHWAQSWEVGRPSPIPYFRHIMVVESSNDEYSMKFTGTRLGMLGVYFPEQSKDPFTVPEYSLDGSAWKSIPKTAVADKEKPSVWLSRIADGLDAEKEHLLKLRVPSGSDTVRIGAILVDGEVVPKIPAEGLTDLERIDLMYATIPPINYTPPKDRWKNLSKTMEKLRNGPSLKIVMLGDSIMEDTTSSQYELLLERQYPKCKIIKINSLRGSTGCWWFKDENRVEDWVLKHEPDLVMIGGISHHEDVDAVRSVVRQIRAKQNPEIMLISPVFGTPGWYANKWSYEVDAKKDPFRAGLKQIAEEENCEFTDLTAPFWQYIMDSQKTYGWFMRDSVHANGRGFQIIGRLLVRYMTE